ncbi:MAG: hypothetical protein RDU59_01350 [Thermodesulfobacteriota bacterium]|nr:hypothetical protein [Thermodesulfobacteriota bacterium]
MQAIINLTTVIALGPRISSVSKLIYLVEVCDILYAMIMTANIIFSYQLSFFIVIEKKEGSVKNKRGVLGVKGEIPKGLAERRPGIAFFDAAD